MSMSFGMTWAIFATYYGGDINSVVSFSYNHHSRTSRSVGCDPSIFLPTKQKESSLFCDSNAPESEDDSNIQGPHISRRNVLEASGSFSLLLSLLSIPQPSNAEMDSKFTFRTTNVPIKYSGTSTPASFTNKEQDCMEQTTESKRINVFERASPSTVYIDTYVEQRDAFSPNVMEIPLGTGSGIIWDDKGHIVTNYHVVRSAKSAQVSILTRVKPDEENTKSSGSKGNSSGSISSKPKIRKQLDPNLTEFRSKMYKAKVIGVDPGKDIAVLKVDAPDIDLYPIDRGTSIGLRVGQTAMAIGNPFGLDHTLTAGIISGIGREVKSPIGRPISNVIQTDAPINPGNSGGPLLDSKGKLIGMNTSIFSPSGASAGIGFAIPVDTVQYIVETLIRDGKIVRPVMGISYMQSSQAKALGISKGVLVLAVPPNSPAAKAGMKGTRRTESGLIEIGDIIIKIEDEDIKTEADLINSLESFKPGDEIRVTVNHPEYEGPNSTKLKLKEVVLKLKLKASDDIPVAQMIIVE
eukprot:CAMPEP_0197834290 /NCGR_PEP_ID=MMETSP1437-20131217/21913_1 /TAXON_ID=49252 ORGANISM="Eucampia antarctica, Strain CCMP1452" /NCGR_SAMPLE_ID=MMETSP1437 /ASSEMBLY_ACC=CAM_ASM_001096 /LENGTH=521 /DNA_ID=CAMNT_0043438861 /DNA_START=94 /DNA_END=1659 /DNA_ORIENTATION=+